MRISASNWTQCLRKPGIWGTTSYQLFPKFRKFLTIRLFTARCKAYSVQTTSCIHTDTVISINRVAKVKISIKIVTQATNRSVVTDAVGRWRSIIRRMSQKTWDLRLSYPAHSIMRRVKVRMNSQKSRSVAKQAL